MLATTLIGIKCGCAVENFFDAHSTWAKASNDSQRRGHKARLTMTMAEQRHKSYKLSLAVWDDLDVVTMYQLLRQTDQFRLKKDAWARLKCYGSLIS
jgi:hypothetical protein